TAIGTRVATVSADAGVFRRGLRALQAVTDAGFGADEVAAGGLELAAQVGHVDAQVLGLAGVLRAPDLEQELLPGHDAAGARGQHGEELELDRGQVDLGVRDEDAPRRLVDPQRAALEDTARRVAGRA